MKKIYLLFITLLIGFCALGQNTVTLESGTTGFQPQFRYKPITPDSLNHLWLYNPLTAKYNRMFSATESNLLYLKITDANIGFMHLTGNVNESGNGLKTFAPNITVTADNQTFNVFTVNPSVSNTGGFLAPTLTARFNNLRLLASSYRGLDGMGGMTAFGGTTTLGGDNRIRLQTVGNGSQTLFEGGNSVGNTTIRPYHSEHRVNIAPDGGGVKIGGSGTVISPTSGPIVIGLQISPRLQPLHNNDTLVLVQIDSTFSFGTGNTIATYDNLVGGAGYTDGSYSNVDVLNGSGSGAKANVVVSGGAVTSVTITNGGGGYIIGDLVNFSTTAIGTGGGTSARIRVASLAQYTGAMKRGLVVKTTEKSEFNGKIDVNQTIADGDSTNTLANTKWVKRQISGASGSQDLQSVGNNGYTTTTPLVTTNTLVTGDSTSTRWEIGYGTSIMLAISAGQYLSNAVSFMFFCAQNIGFIPVNYGRSGRTTQMIATGDSSFYEIRNTFQPPPNSQSYLILEVSANDINQDTTVFKKNIFSPQLSAVVDGAISATWAPDHIILLQPSYYNYAGFVNHGYIPYRHNIYAAAMDSIASAKGTRFLDNWDAVRTQNNLTHDLVNADSLHLTVLGQQFIGNRLSTYISTFAPSYNYNSQKIQNYASLYNLGKISGYNGMYINGTVNIYGQTLFQSVYGTRTLLQNSNQLANRMDDGVKPATAVTGTGLLELATNGTGDLRLLGAGSSTRGVIRFTAAGGTTDVPTTVANNRVLGDIFFTGYDGTTAQSTANISALVTGTVSSGVVPTALRFYTSATNGSSRTEYMRLRETGSLNILTNMFIGSLTGTPNARLVLPAGTATAGTAPLRFQSGPLLTTAVAGMDEFLSDKRYFTITTGIARKEYTFNDVALNTSIVPVTTTNGRLTNSAVTSTELGYLSGVTSAIQTQLNAKGAGTVTSVAGTTNRVTSTGGAAPQIDISPAFEALLGKLPGTQTWLGVNTFSNNTVQQAGHPFIFTDFSGFSGNLYPLTLTANQNWSLPNASGVILVDSQAPSILATVTGINAKTTGTTVLYNVPSGKTAVITAAIVRCTAANTITIGPSADVGDSITGAASIYANTAIMALTAPPKAFGYSSVGMFNTVAASGVINFNINTAATGTSQTISVTLIGYLQ